MSGSGCARPYSVTFIMNGAKPPRGGELGLIATIEGLRKDLFKPRLLYARENVVVSRVKAMGVESRAFLLDAKTAALYFRNTSLLNPIVSIGVMTRIAKSGVVGEVARALREWQTELLYCCDNSSKLIGGLAATRCRIPTIGRCHDVAGTDVVGWAMAAINVLSLNCIIAISDAVRRSLPFASLIPGKLILVPHGIDSAHFNPGRVSPLNVEEYESRPRTVIVSIGALDHNKGQADLLLAVSALSSEERMGLQVWIVGTGPEETPLRRLARDRGIDDVTRFLGFREDVAAILKTADVLVLPTRYFESFGMSALEAMAMEVPVIGTRVGGIPEVIGNSSEVGLLVAPGDVSQLRDALRHLLYDETLRLRMGRNGRRRAIEVFPHENVQLAIEKAFLNLLRKRPRRVEAPVPTRVC